MFCTKCGTDLPDDSQFCRKCGQSLAAAPGAGASASTAPAPTVPTPRAKAAASKVVWVGLVLALVIAAFVYKSNQQQAGTASPPAPTIVHRRITIGTGALTVPATSNVYFTLTVPAGASNVRLEGHFTATGGSGNDVEVVLFNEDGYTNWKNGHTASTFYNSGKVTAATVDAALPNGPATYYLVFNNQFSLLSPKAVQENLALTYYQ